jgi:hypothetical protein
MDTQMIGESKTVAGAVHEIVSAVNVEGVTIILAVVGGMVIFITAALLFPKVSYYIQRWIKW